jgi:hypothetical protein
VKKLLNAATGEVSRTKAVIPRELADFAGAVSDGVRHGTKEVFDFLEALDLDDDNLRYNDNLVLTSILLKAQELKRAGVGPCIFASVDKSDLAAHGPPPEDGAVLRRSRPRVPSELCRA